MTNIVTTWLEATIAQGMTITQATVALGDAVGMVITTSRVREWERGQRQLPGPVYNHMLELALETALAAEGVNVGIDKKLLGPVGQKLSVPSGK